MFLRRKRGISNIVASVLIILLAIVAVSLIGYLVYKLINDSGDEIECNDNLNAVSFEIVDETVNIVNKEVTFRVDRTDSREEADAFPIVELISDSDDPYSTTARI